MFFRSYWEREQPERELLLDSSAGKSCSKLLSPFPWLCFTISSLCSKNHMVGWGYSIKHHVFFTEILKFNRFSPSTVSSHHLKPVCWLIMMLHCPSSRGGRKQRLPTHPKEAHTDLGSELRALSMSQITSRPEGAMAINTFRNRVSRLIRCC